MTRLLFACLLLASCSTAPHPTPIPTTSAAPSPVATASLPLASRVAAYNMPYAPNMVDFDVDGTAWLGIDSSVWTIPPGGPAAATPIGSVGLTSQLGVDAEGVWLSDTCCGVSRFDRSGRKIATFQAFGTDWTTVAFRRDVDGNLWISQFIGDRLHKLAPDGHELLVVEHQGARAIFNDHASNLVVCAPDHVATLQRDGRVITSTPTGGNLTAPVLDAQDVVWGYNVSTQAIERFDAAGRTTVKQVPDLVSLAVTRSGVALYLDGQGVLTRVGEPPRQQALGATACYLDRTDRLWAFSKQEQGVRATVYQLDLPLLGPGLRGL